MQRQSIEKWAQFLECSKLISFRIYIRYWLKLFLAHLSSWGFGQFLLPPSTLGTLHAKLDLSNGLTKVFYSGLEPLWYSDAEQILREKYRIQYVNLNHLDHSEWHETYEKSYNRVSKSHVRRRLGVDVIELCLTRAEFQYRSQEKVNLSKQIQISA